MKEHSRPCRVLTTKIITIMWTDPTEGQHHSSQSGRTQPGSNLYNSKMWTDPTRVKLISPQSGRIPPRVNTTVHEVDGPNQGQTYTSPKSGRTQPGSNLYKSKKWTDPTRIKLIQLQKEDGPYHWSTPVHEVDKCNHCWTYNSPQSGRTLPTIQDPYPHNGRTQPVHKMIQVHKVDGHQGSRPHSTEWTDPTRFANIIKVHNVGGSN